MKQYRININKTHICCGKHVLKIKLFFFFKLRVFEWTFLSSKPILLELTFFGKPATFSNRFLKKKNKKKGPFFQALFTRGRFSFAVISLQIPSKRYKTKFRRRSFVFHILTAHAEFTILCAFRRH